MSIKIYSGRPGSGKSYNAIANILIPALQQSRTVVTNVVLNKSKIYEDYPDANIITFPFGITQKESEKYINLERYPAGSVFVIDEGAKLFPTGWKVTTVPSSLLTFFTEHRHSVGPDGYAAEIFVLCQDNSQLSKFIRDLVDTTYHHVKLDKHGMSNTFRVDIYDGSVNGASHRGSPTDSKVGKYKKDIFQFYQSHTQKVSTVDTALESSPDKRGSHMHVYYTAAFAVPVFFLLAYLAFSSLTSFMSGSDESVQDFENQDSTFHTEDVVTSLPYVEPVFSKQRSDPAPLSKDWRLSGVVSSVTGVFAIIESDDRTRVLNALSSCDYDQDLSEWFCVLDGHVVASYTGPVWNPDDSGDGYLPFTD